MAPRGALAAPPGVAQTKRRKRCLMVARQAVPQAVPCGGAASGAQSSARWWRGKQCRMVARQAGCPKRCLIVAPQAMPDSEAASAAHW